MKSKKEFFNKLADNWDKSDIVSPEKYRRIIFEAKIMKGQNILDVGTGTGVLIPYILEVERETNIFAIDFAERMIEKLKEKNFPVNVRPFVMNIRDTIFEDNFFDRVIVNSCYPHFEEKPSVLREIYRILKENGFLIISHPTGRRFINELHKTTHPLIERDILRGIPELKRFIEKFGFLFVKGIDEDDFFLLVFMKSSQIYR
ncbi:MAG TPA: class I SAM-dependent methyltransferase [bacterium]|nr:class I SAM-dependent methyltransferase [bacterium]HPP29775.1 class I SAM-dependent methyltransferase [bacterium]